MTAYTDRLPPLETGDILLVEGGMPYVSASIRAIERFWSKDNQSPYGHAAIVAQPGGTLLDTLIRVRWSHISNYSGQRAVIYRPVRNRCGSLISPETKRVALAAISSEGHGRIYPVWRLGLFLVPPLAKYVFTGANLVCSERAGKMLVCINAGVAGDRWAGLMPDDLADGMSLACPGWFDRVFEGVLP